MAKRIKPTKELMTIGSWDDADEIIKQIGQYQNKLELLAVDTDSKIVALKERLKADARPNQLAIKTRMDSLEMFADSRRTIDFCETRRSKKLIFGLCGWRKSSSIKDSKTTLAKIKLLLAGKKEELINVKESVSKDGLEKLTDEELKTIDARRITTDYFFVEPDSVTIAKTV